MIGSFDLMFILITLFKFLSMHVYFVDIWTFSLSGSCFSCSTRLTSVSRHSFRRFSIDCQHQLLSRLRVSNFALTLFIWRAHMKTNVASEFCGRPPLLTFSGLLFFRLGQICHFYCLRQSMSVTNSIISQLPCKYHEKLWLCLPVLLLNETIFVSCKR